MKFIIIGLFLISCECQDKHTLKSMAIRQSELATEIANVQIELSLADQTDSLGNYSELSDQLVDLSTEKAILEIEMVSLAEHSQCLR